LGFLICLSRGSDLVGFLTWCFLYVLPKESDLGAFFTKDSLFSSRRIRTLCRFCVLRWIAGRGGVTCSRFSPSLARSFHCFPACQLQLVNYLFFGVVLVIASPLSPPRSPSPSTPPFLHLLPTPAALSRQTGFVPQINSKTI